MSYGRYSAKKCKVVTPWTRRKGKWVKVVSYNGKRAVAEVKGGLIRAGSGRSSVSGYHGGTMSSKKARATTMACEWARGSR